MAVRYSSSEWQYGKNSTGTRFGFDQKQLKFRGREQGGVRNSGGVKMFNSRQALWGGSSGPAGFAAPVYF